ncbi:NACHT, LRR and PYD domains-containing protein 3-like [Mantella aurantiaca]
MSPDELWDYAVLADERRDLCRQRLLGTRCPQLMGSVRLAHSWVDQDSIVQYMTEMKRRFQCVKEHNSRIGEAVSLDRRYTRLVMVKRYQNKQEKVHEITSLGLRHQQIMDKRSSDECVGTLPQTLFNPNEQGLTPQIVVLQGPAGIGKTMTSRKIMLDWASGNLYRDNFSFVFYLSCRELNTITEKISLAGLLSRTSKFQFSENVMQSMLSNSRRLLFIIDGFDEVRWTQKDDFNVCGDPLQETHRECLLRSLINQHVLCEASLIITTRPFALERLDELIEDVCSCHVEILGFTGEDCEEYFHNSFSNEDDAKKALSLIKDNDVLYTMCAVPITCWIVCTVLKQEIENDLDLIQCRTATSVYLLYLKGLIKYHGKKQPVHHCLRKLCALAKEGVLRRQILFEEEDLERHELSMSEVESIFLNENIFHQEIDSISFYSFIHLSMQEFFAALYYVIEEKNEEKRGQEASLPEICQGKSLSQMSYSSPHLSLTVQFLFGLTNEKQLKEVSRITRHDVSFHAASAVRNWLAAEDPSTYRTQTISCLYETQDEGFVRAMMCRSKDLEFHTMKGKIYTRQLAYCLQFSEDISSLTFVCTIMGQKDLEILSPFLSKCSYLKIAYYVTCLPVPCNVLRDLIISHQLKQLDLSEIHLSSLDVNLLCLGLQNPGCTLQELSLFCDLNHFTCHHLHRVTWMIKRSFELYVIFQVTFANAPEVEKMCQMLKLPGYTFLEDSMLRNKHFSPFSRTIYFAYQNSCCRPKGTKPIRGMTAESGSGTMVATSDVRFPKVDRETEVLSSHFRLDWVVLGGSPPGPPPHLTPKPRKPGGMRPFMNAAVFPTLFQFGVPFGPRMLVSPRHDFI